MMKPFVSPRLFNQHIMQEYSHLNEREAKYFYDCQNFHSQKDEQVLAEYDDELMSLFRRALNMRYWIVRTHFISDACGSTNEELFEDCTIHLPQEPATVAATLALQLKEQVEWEAVEAWSWVYHHALLLHIEIDDFEAWCECQSPAPSHRFVMSAITQSSHRAKLLRKGTPTISDAAVGNA